MDSQLLKVQEEIENLRLSIDKLNLKDLALASLDCEDKFESILNLVGEEGESNQKTVNKFNTLYT